MTEITVPGTLEGLYARYREIAPQASQGSPFAAQKLARLMLVSALRRNTRATDIALRADQAISPDALSALCAQFAVVHLMQSPHRDIDDVAAEILGAWDDGGGIGEWLWEHAQALGIDADEVSRLAEAEAQLEAASVKPSDTERAGPGQARADAEAGISEGQAALAARWRETADELEEGRFSDSPGNIAEAETLRECARQLDAVAAQKPQPAPCDLPVATPAVTRPVFGSTLILAVPPGADEADVQRLRDHLAASAPDDCVTVVAVRGIEALRTWDPQPAPELAALRAERDGLAELVRRYERITTSWTRGMYAARIDCQHGDVKAAIGCLSEGLDGYDGTEWNGTETGAEWWERTKAEEGL